jgi:hypothetical protein
MRLIAVLFLLLPLFAQQPPAEVKPDAQAAPGTEPQAASPMPPTESWINGYVDVGYRWVADVAGSYQQYRSIVNLGEGPKLFGFDLTLQGRKLFNTLTLRGIGWGGDSYNTAQVEVRKAKLYDLRFDYRNIAYFNAVPSYANPSAPDGLSPLGFNERAFDINRRDASFELDLFPGSRIIPFLAYDRDSAGGHGIETWVLGATNEFPIPYLLRNHADRYRGGLRLEFNRFHLTFEQGGNVFKEDDNTYWTGSNPGDRAAPVAGQRTSLTSLNQAYGIRNTGIFSRILATARPVDWLHLHGQFLFSQPKTTVNYSEIATGNLYDVTGQAFFPGQYAIASGNALQPHTSGNGGVEFQWKRIRILESLNVDRFHDAGFGLFSPQVYQSFLTLPATALNTFQQVSSTQSQTDVLADIGFRITLRGGYRYTTGDATVRAGNLSQTGPLETDHLHRNAGLAGFTYRRLQRLSLNGSYEGASSDHVYYRTSLNEYQRGGLNAKLQLTGSLVLQARFRVLDNQNRAPDIQLDYRSRDNAASIYWTPNGGKRVSFMGDYDRATVRSDIRYIDLPFLTPATSSYRDTAHQATAAMDIVLPRLTGAKLTAGGSLFISHGSRPTRYYQPLARMSVPLHKNVLWNSEWQYYGFGEQFYYFEGFRTHVFMTGLRLTR